MKKRKKSNKNKFLLVITILIIVCLLGYAFYKYKEIKVIYDDEVVIALNVEYYNLDNIKEVINGEVTTQKERIDTSKIGEFDIKFNAKDIFKIGHEYSYKLIINDTNPPVITYKDSISVVEGSSINLLEGVSALDDSGEDILVEVEGNYDLNTPGDYELYYVARDSSGNEAKESFILKVTKKVSVLTETIVEDRVFTTSNGFKGETKNGITYIDGVLIANKTYSLPSTYNPGDLTSETKAAAQKMFNAASKGGYNLYAKSGFRSYGTQKIIYQNYVARDGQAKADTYSARPGYSEHQSGLAFDVCITGNTVNCVNSGFNNTSEAKWLSENAYKYGFILRYPEGKTNETGYMYESWHFRYVGEELASKLYNNGTWITLESYFGITSSYN